MTDWVRVESRNHERAPGACDRETTEKILATPALVKELPEPIRRVIEHSRVFEKFYRLDPNTTRGVGGTGLGLYICRELVDRMHGRIWVESQPGQGSSFHVELPAAIAE